MHRKLTLIQWPKSAGVDSAYSRCVMLQRLLALKRVRYDLKDVAFVETGETAAQTLERLLMNLPMLQVDGTLVRGAREIERFILEEYPKPEVHPADAALRALDGIFRDWADEVLAEYLIYARWKIEGNYRRMVKAFLADPSLAIPGAEEGLDLIRATLLTSLSSREIGEANEVTFHRSLRVQLRRMDDWLEEREYLLGGKHLTLCDLSVFSIVQGLMASELSESEFVRRDFPHLKRWAHRIDRETQSSFTERLGT